MLENFIMEKYIYDEKNELWYELHVDYYIPCLELPTEKEQPIGIWGQWHKAYLKKNTESFCTLICSQAAS